MAEGTTENATRLRDWIILIFVLVVMGLLITDIGGNVKDIFDRNQEPASELSLLHKSQPFFCRRVLQGPPTNTSMPFSRALKDAPTII